MSKPPVNRIHGHATTAHRTPTYVTWQHMKDRCGNPRNERYSDYGGRGIAVCPAWVASFEAFLADMGERPEGKTLDRIDVHGNYEPGNCRWATCEDQNINRRNASWNQAKARRKNGHSRRVTDAEE